MQLTMTNCCPCFRSICNAALLPCLLAWSCSAVSIAAAADDDLTPLEYHQSELAVDLGVGLWAWPVPCDADADGDFDLIVSCPDKPFNGVWLFENTTGDTAKDKFPVFKPPRRLSRTVHYVLPSYVDGKLRGAFAAAPSIPTSSTPGSNKRSPLPAAQDDSQPARQCTRRARQDPPPRVALCRLRRRRAARPGRGHRGLERLRLGRRLGCARTVDQRPAARLRLLASQHRHERQARVRRAGAGDGRRQAGRYVRLPHAELRRLRRRRRSGFAVRRVSGRVHLLRKHRHRAASPNTPPAGACTRPTASRWRWICEMIVPIAFDWDRDGDLDLVVGDEDGRVALVENTGRLARRRHAAVRAAALLLSSRPTCSSAARWPRRSACDWDGDGDTDIVSGNTAGYIELFENLSGPGRRRAAVGGSAAIGSRRQDVSRDGRPQRQHPRAGRSQVGLHDALGGRLGSRRSARHRVQLDLGARRVAAKRRHAQRAEAGRRRGRSKSSGPARRPSPRGPGGRPKGKSWSPNGAPRRWCTTSPATDCRIWPCSTPKATWRCSSGSDAAMNWCCCRRGARSSTSRASRCD